MKKQLRRLASVLMAIVIIATAYSGCSIIQEQETTTQQSTTTTTTETTTTTMRTTEDLNTTFVENGTNKVYPALTKDKDGDYPYDISSYTTYYDSGNATRTTNVHNAVDKLNMLKIPSGKTFSFNQTVGKRTVLAGYQEAKVVNGQEFVDGLGGGICQVSSTVFQAVLRANLEIKVRACHSLEIFYVPLGGDATVQWNSQDFQFVNNSGCDIRLKVVADSGTLTCTVYAKENIKPEKLSVDIEKSGDNYTLIRTVDGEVNYRTYSKYSKPITTTVKKETTKKDKDKDKETTKKKKQ